MKEVKKLGCEVGQGQGRVTAAPVLCPSPSSRRFSRIHSARACVVAIPRMSSMDHNAISLVLFTPQRSLVVLASSVKRRHRGRNRMVQAGNCYYSGDPRLDNRSGTGLYSVCVATINKKSGCWCSMPPSYMSVA